MYHPALIAADHAKVQRQFSAVFKGEPMPEYTVDDSATLTAMAMSAIDPETGQLTRPLSDEEQRFVASSRLRVIYDYPWFAERFVWIDEEGHGLRRLSPMWESQRMVLDQLAAIEIANVRSKSPDGLLLNVLKARQLGVSTLAESLVAHRLVTRAHVRALSGADVEEQAGYLFRMVVRIYDQLPWFLKPGRVYFNKNRELSLANQCFLKTAWGKSTRGALQSISGAEGSKGSIGRGQSQPLDARVLTPTGYLPMGEVTVGSFVIGSNGQPTAVTGVFPQDGVLPIYRVHCSDGTFVECSLDHLWSVYVRDRSEDAERFVTRTTADLLCDGLRGHKGIYRYRLPLTAPVTFFGACPVSLDPYVVGVLLGDGNLSQGAAKFSTVDADLAAHVGALLPSGHRLSVTPESEKCPSYTIVSDTPRQRVRQALRDLGLAGCRAETKFVPPRYLYAGVSDRVRLLQGLLDSDGWSEPHGVVGYVSVSEQLASGVQQLVESLGGIASWHERPEPKFQHQGETRIGQRQYRLAIRLPQSITPFWLARKLDAHDSSAAASKGPVRRIVAIEYVADKPAQCIRVDAPDALYLTDHCLVTHNTYSVVHISELPTWENPEQLDTALLPAIPYSPDTLVLYEATAEFAGDWWHQHWLASGAGEGRFKNVFIPWSAEPRKYSLPAPDDWQPSATTLAHAVKCEKDSPKWYAGATVRLTRDQLYWYERTRSFYEKKGQLYKFLKEYPADDLECFQYAGRSVFTLEQLEAIDRAGSLRPLKDVWSVEPALDIAQLRATVLDGDERNPDYQPKRVIPPLAPHDPATRLGGTIAHELHPVPPGYGFRRLSAIDLKAMPNLRQSVLAIWEYPRLRGHRRYILAVDVSDGLGQDYSIIDVIRQPTIEEPAEQVAQYCTNKLDPKQLAFVCDAVGRYYSDADQVEALCAIETNNHGLATQDTLQLHLGYNHFYVWEYADAASVERRYSTRIGWMTTPRTRPLLLASYYGAITAFDPVTTLPDLILNSPVTRGELRHFITATTIGEAEAARGQHDDAVMASAIGYYVAWRMAGGEVEPVAERRRRKAALDQLHRDNATPRPDYRNSPATVQEADDLEGEHESVESTDYSALTDADPHGGGLYFNDRDRA